MLPCVRAASCRLEESRSQSIPHDFPVDGEFLMVRYFDAAYDIIDSNDRQSRTYAAI